MTVATLLPFQEKHFDALVSSLKKHDCVIDASDTGTGKTYIACAIAKKLGYKPIVVSPKAVILSWARVMDQFGVEPLGIANYELFKGGRWYVPDTVSAGGVVSLGKKGKCSLVKVKDKKYTWNRDPAVLDKGDTVLFIFDEAHRCKNKATVNSKMLLSLRSFPGPHKIMLLSATIADKPKFFAVPATMLSLCAETDEFRLFSKVLDRGIAKAMTPVRKGPVVMQAPKGQSTMLNLNKIVFPEYGSRMRVNDLKGVFPDNRVIADSYVMDDEAVEEITKQYDYIKAVHAEAKEREENAPCYLVELLRARQKIESLKVKTIAEMTTDSVQSGNSVVIFVNYLDTMALLQVMLGGIKCVIRGGQTTEERQGHIDDFNNDRERIIICQIQSGGVGISLHDTIGDHPRVSLISPSWSAQDLMQTFGRIHRAQGKTPCIQKLIYCHGTVEDLICRIVNTKLINYKHLNDGSD